MVVETKATVDELSNILADPEAPVESRSLFVCERGDYPRHAELPELLDPLTGLPFPLAPPEKTLPLHNEKVSNWHHGMHPRNHPELQTLGGKAMRSAQVQLVYSSRHNQGGGAFHNFEVGPFVHRIVGHQLGMCGVASAGVVPRLGLRTRGRELWLEPLTDRQRRQWTARAKPEIFAPWHAAVYAKFYGIAGPPQVAEERLAERNQRRADMSYRNVHYGFPAMQTFFTEQMMGQDLSNAGDRLQTFLRRPNNTNGLALMDSAIAELVRNTVTYNGQTLKTLYDSLKRADALNPAMPADIEDIIKYKIGNTTTRRALVPEFYRRLRQRKETPVAA